MLYADFFLDQANRELDKRVVGFDPEAENCSWPAIGPEICGNEERRDPGGSADDGRVRHSGRAARRIVGGCSGARSLCAIRREKRSGSGGRWRRPAATNPRRPGCWGSIARRSTTNCNCTASNSRRVWKYSTSFWGFPHRSTAAYKIINFLYL